ncbi:bifunctional methylenetetrahydrofolate dehydrogenase/methenyltetrahydrofolate cyclohydrolase FolD [Robertmurraya korlensis]|uniref:bifunctional methylenetetrahydrofolate dehydrogenase/methenyltetrahydrofolate cyclohydrolase FolD n=1 Tax=Robertmurraya korlensis TaxID=519977 RepID=UPI00203ED6BD|nr:bifunctional methylenetetrahydrofolate dehydrogenase/methenyltetrahydrofolate cyclohydrolase FolD [Robertmurraya korlensis]
MTAQTIDGKEVSIKKRIEIQSNVQNLKKEGVVPGLAVILVGNDDASRTYVANKQKACKELGIYSELITFDSTVSQDILLSKIYELNECKEIHGILVQLPLPEHLDEDEIINAISPMKDVDGFHPINVGKMVIGQDALMPCTPSGVIVMLEENGISLSGKHVVIVGRSNIVGKPLGQMLLNRDATVTYCHSKTRDLRSYTNQADILIAAVGRANFITADYVRQGAVVIDVGINRNEQGKLCGDVAYHQVKEKTSYITPVPGGVGPMTITMLMYNTVKAARKAIQG